jgi:hypothetical protein
MGQRTVKRVPLDFKWPRWKVWEGYRNPHPAPPRCNACGGSSLNPDTKRLFDTFPKWCRALTPDEIQALVDNGRLLPLTHERVPGKGWRKRADGRMPTMRDVLKHCTRPGFGWEVVSQIVLVRARATRLGVFGRCPACNAGWLPHPDPEVGKLHAAWKATEPPRGEGWQLWETTSEGSPVSPVFPTARKLARWCAKYATLFAEHKTTERVWLRLITGRDDIEAASRLALTVEAGKFAITPVCKLPRGPKKRKPRS